jgi:hypothetical protein
VDKFRSRAEAMADEVESDSVRRLLYFLVDTVLEKQDAASESENNSTPLIQLGKSR